MKKTMPIIIPAYEPDERLLSLLNTLNMEKIEPVIIVDDGSGKGYSAVFAQAEALVKPNNGVLLVHETNKGKGRALKTAFRYILENIPDSEGAVTADSDGQHTADCIKKIMKALSDNPNSLILGVRNLKGEDIPWKSRIGNSVTERVFTFVAGIHISDTQTGLRGIPREFMQLLLNVPGERFEFETQMLLESVKKYPIKEIPIKTIYDSAENHQTHFNPLIDSLKIYRILGKRFLNYFFSSISSSVVDLILFLVFCRLLENKWGFYVATATILARIISAVYNYSINYLLVFKSKEKISNSGIKYFVLAVAQMGISALLVSAGVSLLPFIPKIITKIIIDSILFLASYYIQHKYVF